MNQQLEEYLAAYRADWIKAGPPSPQVVVAMVEEIDRLRADRLRLACVVLGISPDHNTQTAEEVEATEGLALAIAREALAAALGGEIPSRKPG